MTIFNHSAFQPLDLKRQPARTYEKCRRCDNGVDINGCQCRSCKGSGAVCRYLTPRTDWQRPARPQL